jgi:hypothetical protein
MPRTVKQVDKDLSDAVATRRTCRAELAKRTLSANRPRSTSRSARTLMDERIERLLDERSQAQTAGRAGRAVTSQP